MSGRKRRRLDSTVAAIQQRYGAQALQRGDRALRTARGPHISTGFPTLDAVTGCDGVPGNAMTLLCGQSTSGKLTVAYKTLAAAQQHGRGGQVAIVDLAHHSDPDYLARCGIDLERLLLVRHHAGLDVPALLVDLVRTREVRLILLDNVSDLLAERGMAPDRAERTVLDRCGGTEKLAVSRLRRWRGDTSPQNPGCDLEAHIGRRSRELPYIYGAECETRQNLQSASQTTRATCGGLAG